MDDSVAFVALELRLLTAQLVEAVGRLNDGVNKLSDVLSKLERGGRDEHVEQQEQAENAGPGLLWSVDIKFRTLCGPDSGSVRLALTELRLVDYLLSRVDQYVTYEELFIAGTFNRNAKDVHDMARFVSGVMARVRAKGAKSGMDIPIKTIRSVGYVFSSRD